MINVKFGEVVLVNAKLHFGLRIPDAFLHLMPCVVLQLQILDLQSNVEEVLDVPIVDDVKEDSDSSKYPKDHRQNDESVCQGGKVHVTLL